VVSRSTVRCQPDLESGSSAEFLQGFSQELKAFRRGLSEVSKFVLSTTTVDCACHKFKLPTGVGDLKKGEK
jgi:hypothetical protein